VKIASTAALPRAPARGRKWEYFRRVNPGSECPSKRARETIDSPASSSFGGAEVAMAEDAGSAIDAAGVGVYDLLISPLIKARGVEPEEGPAIEEP
jgi:hypothetical protein